MCRLHSEFLKQKYIKVCLDLVNYNHIYPFEKLNISQSACACFNLLSLMTMLSGVYRFPEPFAKTSQPWNFGNHCYEYRAESQLLRTVETRVLGGISKDYFHLEEPHRLVAYSKTVLGHSLVLSQKIQGQEHRCRRSKGQAALQRCYNDKSVLHFLKSVEKWFTRELESSCC